MSTSTAQGPSTSPDTVQLFGYVEQSQQRLAELQEKFGADHSADVRASKTSYSFTGEAVFKTASAVTEVQVVSTHFRDLNPDFCGHAVGVDGAGTTRGGGVFSIPASQLGYAKIQIAITPTYVEISFWDDEDDPIGVFTGPGIEPVGVFRGGGFGEWGL